MKKPGKEGHRVVIYVNDAIHRAIALRKIRTTRGRATLATVFAELLAREFAQELAELERIDRLQSREGDNGNGLPATPEGKQ